LSAGRGSRRESAVAQLSTLGIVSAMSISILSNLCSAAALVYLGFFDGNYLVFFALVVVVCFIRRLEPRLKDWRQTTPFVCLCFMAIGVALFIGLIYHIMWLQIGAFATLLIGQLYYDFTCLHSPDA
jgi:hypothetical protein